MPTCYMHQLSDDDSDTLRFRKTSKDAKAAIARKESRVFFMILMGSFRQRVILVISISIQAGNEMARRLLPRYAPVSFPHLISPSRQMMKRFG